MPHTNEELRALGHLKDRLDAANAAKKQAENEHKRHQWECFRRMEEEGIESMRVDGVTYSPVGKPYAQEQDRTKFVDWCNEVVHEYVDDYGETVTVRRAPELIEYKPRMEQCNALVREYLDDNVELPPGLGYYDREYISQTVKS